MRKLMAVWIFCLVTSLVAQAQVGSHLKEQFQDPEKHGTRIIDNISQVRGAIHDDKVRVLCLQSFDEMLPPDTQAELLEWVRSGKTVWFYDARLAPQFGMKPYFLAAEQFRNKPEKGEMGGSPRRGLATTCVSMGQHAVQTGVGQVTLFLPDTQLEGEEEFVYGAVEVAGDTVPLLQFELDSPAVMALRREGRGLIVFKQLLWNEAVSGDRFQLNLLDFSAGFQVPGPAGEGKIGTPPGPQAEYVKGDPAVPLEPGAVPQANVALPLTTPPVANRQPGPAQPAKASWSLQLKDGTTMQGELEGDFLEFETGTQSLKLKPDEISVLELGSSIKLDKLTTVSGRTQSGVLMSSPLKFRTDRGVEEFEKEDLERLQREAQPSKEK